MEGKIHKVLTPRSGTSSSGKTWKAVEFVIKTKDTFLCLTALGDKVDLLKDVKEGEDVEVEFNISSREYRDRWYTALTVTGLQFTNRFSDDPVDSEPPDSEKDDLPFSFILPLIGIGLTGLFHVAQFMA